jgi:hypothetical protein
MQSVAGVGYLFGSLSPVIKASLGYNQRQVASLGVAKDLGDSVGFFAGTLCAILPLWAALLIGAVQNLVGYGWVWLAVTRRVAVPPLWAVRSVAYPIPQLSFNLPLADASVSFSFLQSHMSASINQSVLFLQPHVLLLADYSDIILRLLS